MIPPAFIQDLLARVDVADVVGRHVKLRKAGANLIGLCPFHGEKSPSFTVSPSKQFYHCFGCQAHGSAISFLMEHAGLSFVEAVEDLAREQGLNVPHEKGTGAKAADPGRPNLIELLGQATRYYQRRLRESPQAIEYLKGRGLSGVTAARFALGFSPPGWRNLEAAASDYDDPAWEQAGMVKTNADQQGARTEETDQGSDSGGGRRDKRYDRFRDRIMFPIRNPRGGVIGFGGRILYQGEPKYLNSPETPVFSKGRELYGLFEGRQSLREKNQAIVVEGYMDVVMLAEHGVDNAVATLGTATTNDHLRKLLRQVDHLVFSFDGDKAGRKAAWRALTTALPIVTDTQQISFLFLPEGADPDSYVQEFGADGFYRQIDQALSLSAFMVQGLTDGIDMASPEGRAKFLAATRPLLLSLTAEGLKMQLRHEIAEQGRIGLAELDRFLEAGEAAAAAQAERERGYARRREEAARTESGVSEGADDDPDWRAQAGGDAAASGPEPWENPSGQQRQRGKQRPNWRSDRRPAAGRQVRAGRPNLDRRLRLLTICHPALCRAALDSIDPAIMTPELLRWFEAVAQVSEGASPQAVLQDLRPAGFPDLEQVEQDLASQLGGVSLLNEEEALHELEGAFEQLERRALRQAATSLVEKGLETEEQRKIHRDLLASKR